MDEEVALCRVRWVGEDLDRVIACWPDRLALSDGDASLSYGELSRYGACLAAELRDAGVGPGRLIGVCLPRGLSRVALMFAAWKLGAVVVLLDPAWPDLRIAEITNDAECDLVVLEEGAGGCGLPADRLLFLGKDAWKRPDRASHAGFVLDSVPGPDDLAYVIYTSGSTGRPKGVEITHGNLAALVAWHNGAFAVSHLDRATHLAGLAFDASVWEVWPYLAAGASVHVVPELARGLAERLRDWLVEVQATIAFAPTLLAEKLIALPWPATPLRTLLTGGDRLRSVPRPGLPFTLVNNYGPTECTVVACSGPVSCDRTAGQLPPIGRPIAGSYVRILDSLGRQMADGEVGEICIGGLNVGRGYRGQREATAAAFIPDALDGRPDARLYRTGDLGSWRADGAIDFHGRADNQLKIRGQRIEPDEVAAALVLHPGVASAAVVGLDRPDGIALAAYVEPAPGVSPTAEMLHAFLAGRLPRWAVPSHFIMIDRLPVTANGKLDRAALPPLLDNDALSPGGHAGADSPAEKRLLAILGEVLGTREIGVEDNFFLLGGHSLLGTQVVLRASDAFGVELTLRDLFEAPTVRELAVRIEELIEGMVAAMSDEALLRINA